MTYQEIVNKVAQELNISEEVVDRTYKSFFFFIRENIKNLPLKEDLSEEDFKNLQTNFNVPSLGKFNCTYNRLKGVQEKIKKCKQIKEKYNEHKEN
jgi:nucleoid DNA-binding protein